jgi:DnaJ-class molecular chaperone
VNVKIKIPTGLTEEQRDLIKQFEEIEKQAKGKV